MNERKHRPAPLFGLVAAGGRSRRMGREKGGLTCWRQPQVPRMCRLLQPYVRSVFVSVREEQGDRSWCVNHPRIYDRFRDLGPVSGLLSAMLRFPRVAWLFVACDMPFLDGRGIRPLVRHRNPLKKATVYKAPDENVLEPVCAIYEADFRERVEEQLGHGIQSLRRMLNTSSSVEVVTTPAKRVLTSVDTPSDFERAKRVIHNGGLHHG